MTPNVHNFDQWMRSAFVQMNTELEAFYFAQENKANVAGVGESIKSTLLNEGRAFIIQLLKEGISTKALTQVLLKCGVYIRPAAGMDRQAENKPLMAEASSLALQLGASLGVTPRFCHQSSDHP